MFRRYLLGLGLWLAVFSLAQAQVQNVFVDFNTFTGGSDFVYTIAEQDQVIAKANGIFANFNVNFSRTDPGGTRILVRMNNGGAGGLASDIDFRNLDLGGTADVNINGLGVPASTRPDFVGITGTVVAHEVGHLVGLRHYDCFGAIGRGLPSTGFPAKGDFLPAFPAGGPQLASETTRRLMASPAAVNQTLAEAIGQINISERESVKLTIAGLARNGQAALAPIAEQGAAHGTAGTAQAITLSSINVPNSLPSGAVNFGQTFLVDAVVVTGAITASGQSDFYSFNGTAGDLFYVEVVSNAPNRITDSIDPIVTFTNNAGTTLTNYFGANATNDDNFEDLDSTMFDYTLTTTGTQFVRVTATGSGGSLTGNYELFMYRFRAVAVPEPTTLLLFGMVGVGAVGVRRWRRMGQLAKNGVSDD